MRTILLLLIAACLLAGCSQADSGNVEAAKAAAQAAPRSVDELPADMPPEAKRSAGAAISQGQQMEAKMNAENEARARAMAEMQKQKGR